MSRKIERMYRKEGLKPPNGKGIHTEKFHRCVVKVEGKIKAGKLPAGSSAHAICMASMGADAAVKPKHRKSKATKALMKEAMMLGKVGRRTVQGQSRLKVLLAGLESRMSDLRTERDFYAAEIYGYADAMKRGDWDHRYSRKLIEHANELAAILDEMTTNEARQSELRAQLQLEDLQGKVSQPSIAQVEAKEGP